MRVFIKDNLTYDGFERENFIAQVQVCDVTCLFMGRQLVIRKNVCMYVCMHIYKHILYVCMYVYKV